MKKILHISKYYYPYAGGVEDVCYNIVKHLQTVVGISQRVFCFNDTPQTIDDIYEGIAVTRVGINRILASQPISFSYQRELTRVFHDFQPDVVHFHAPNPLAGYFLLRVLPKTTKLIVHWHSDIVAQKFIYSFIRPLETRMLQRADLILATSPNYLEHSQPLSRFKHKSEVLQNIIDPLKFELTDDRLSQIEFIKREYFNKPIVLFIGRHVPYKGLKFLIEASQLVQSDCTIIIGGRGPLTENLRVLNKSDKVCFVGRIDDDLLAAYYYASDIFVFPSITKNEAFGVVLAEAMYCQTPAITFTIDGSGVNWVNLNNITGLEVSNSNSIELAGAIDRLLQDDQLRKDMSVAARNRVEDLFVLKKISDQLNCIYK